MDSDDEMMSGASSFGDEMIESENESLDFDDDGIEVDAFIQDSKDILKTEQRPFEVEYKVLAPEDIQHQQDEQVSIVSDLLSQPPEASAILLRHMRWDKDRLQEEFWDKQEQILEAAGLEEDETHVRQIKKVANFMCDICCEEDPDLDTYALKCGHRYCVSCYQEYLVSKIRDEAEAARIQCPTSGCNRVVDAKSMDMLLPNDIKDRYHQLLTRTYVDDKDNLKWCPAPNCEYAVSCGVKRKDLDRIVPTVTCNCKHAFCFGCGLQDHLPCPCSLVKMWIKKCEDDSETANWISANTKECPKCNSTIEKNGGCNHMTCRKCKHDFCWMCMGVWSEHGTSYYNCNRYEEKSGSDARDAQARSRQSLERYLHYYNRYANHEQSAKLGKDSYLKAEKQMTSLQNEAGMSWIEVQFLHNANTVVQQCRQILKWTYAFAFYLKRNNSTEMFEDRQKDLEMATENLSEALERPIDQLAKSKREILDRTTYCQRRRIIILSDTAELLKKGEWKFNVDVK